MLPVIRQFFLFGNDKELRNARGIGGPATPSL
jgi:hypothetical protein